MKGMFFVEIVNNQFVSQGQISDDVGRGMWLVTFFAQEGPPVRRVIPAEKCQAMALFPNMQEMETWLKANSSGEGEGEPTGDRKVDPVQPPEGFKREDPPFDTLSVKELRELALGAGIKNAGKAKKADLIEALRAIA